MFTRTSQGEKSISPTPTLAAIHRGSDPLIIPKVKAMKTQTQPRNVLAELRLTLGRLNRTGDFSHPTIANLRRILVQRIAELESAER